MLSRKLKANALLLTALYVVYTVHKSNNKSETEYNYPINLKRSLGVDYYLDDTLLGLDPAILLNSNSIPEIGGRTKDYP